MTNRPKVSMQTLGCARNEVDSEELAARLERDGWELCEDDAAADVIVVNTCGFVAAAKQESIDQILTQSQSGTPVVAAGCLAERYGKELAVELPEAAAVIGFDGYERLGDTLQRVLDGESIPSHEPRDRRELLPIAPVERQGHHTPPGHSTPTGLDLPGSASPVLRRPLQSGPVAPLKIASGCDRRCAFCAIPRFRGAFLSRPPAEIIAEARFLAQQGKRELLLVSENSTSYGKDLGNPRLLETLIGELAAVDGIDRVRISYLQPAELRPSLLSAIVDTPGVVDYFDLSFQHASERLLRSMRRFGSRSAFLELVGQIRSQAPEAGIRSNFIVGFPGETDDDLADLEEFLQRAELDAVGVFGYSDEDNTEAATLPGKIDPDEIAARVDHISATAEYASAARAEARVGTSTQLLVLENHGGFAEGLADFQGLEDGGLSVASAAPPGELLAVRIESADGVDLIGEVTVDG